VNLALITIAILLLGNIVAIIIFAAKGGFKVGATKAELDNRVGTAMTGLGNLKEDIDELRKGIAITNKMRNEDHRDLENLVYKIKDALTSHTGRTINGISYRGEEDEHQ
jgi:hypothetical protein